MGELNRYPWSGHLTIVGRKKRAWQTVDEVLAHFGSRTREAQRSYKEFITAGLSMGTKPELTGGGLKRSAGGWAGIQSLKKAGNKWQGDERMLGDGGFVSKVLREAEEKFTRKEKLYRDGWDLEQVVNHVCKITKVKQEDLSKKGRNNALSRAKCLISYWSKTELGVSGTILANYFELSNQAVSKNVKTGERIVKEEGIKLLS